MFTKRMFTAVLALTVSAAVAAAPVVAGAITYKGVTLLFGSGWCYASGTGSIDVNAQGSALVSGTGKLSLPSGARYHLDGQAWSVLARATSITINGAGSAYVQMPSRLRVVFEGTGAVTTWGTGTAVIAGEGTWKSDSWKASK